MRLHPPPVVIASALALASCARYTVGTSPAGSPYLLPPAHHLRTDRAYVIEVNNLEHAFFPDCSALRLPQAAYPPAEQPAFELGAEAYAPWTPLLDPRYRRFFLNIPPSAPLPRHGWTMAWMRAVVSTWVGLDCYPASGLARTLETVDLELPREFAPDSGFADLGPEWRIVIGRGAGAQPEAIIAGGAEPLDLRAAVESVGAAMHFTPVPVGGAGRAGSRRHWRLYWPDAAGMLGVVIAGSDAMRDLDILSFGTDDVILLLDARPRPTLALLGTWCARRQIVCVAIPRAVPVALEMQVAVDDVPTWVALGTTLRQATQRAAGTGLDDGDARPAKLRRRYGARLVPVRFGSRAERAGDIALVPGDHLDRP